MQKEKFISGMNARKNFMGIITGGRCRFNYCKNPRPERRNR